MQTWISFWVEISLPINILSGVASHAIWACHRFAMSFRYVEDLDLTGNGHLYDEALAVAGIVTGGPLGAGLSVAGILAGSNGPTDGASSGGRNNPR